MRFGMVAFILETGVKIFLEMVSGIRQRIKTHNLCVRGINNHFSQKTGLSTETRFQIMDFGYFCA